MICQEQHFYPRSPCGERPIFGEINARESIFLSTLSLRRATARRALGFVDPDISIHALLAESDAANSGPCNGRLLHFYPRSPCGERQLAKRGEELKGIFLSTLSLRRATSSLSLTRWNRNISIHALLAESDPTRTPTGCVYMYFYPRSPCGERPPQKDFSYLPIEISIHALLAESDFFLVFGVSFICIFLSTLSLRRATRGCCLLP